MSPDPPMTGASAGIGFVIHSSKGDAAAPETGAPLLLSESGLVMYRLQIVILSTCIGTPNL